jgi:hypothetical protein
MSGERLKKRAKMVQHNLIPLGFPQGAAKCLRRQIYYPISQPSLSNIRGFRDAIVVSTRPHFWHSNVRYSYPSGPASSFDSSMRFCRQSGQQGRWMAAVWTEDTG